MKKINKKKVIIIFLLVIIAFVMTSNLKSRAYISGKIFSKNIDDKTSVSIDDLDDKNNLIYINLDGFGYHIYENANMNPLTETKNINMLIENGVLFTNARTGIPSITDPMQQSIVSGAWPSDTGNCYRYYDFEKEEIVEYKRDNKLENISEAANRNGIEQVAINSWFFQDNGSNEEKENLYIESSSDDGYKSRFELLKSVLRGEKIEAYGKQIKYDTPPKFISIYADDIDSAQHNLSDKALANNDLELRKRQDLEKKTIENLLGIDEEIGEVIKILKDRDLYDKTNFVITTDHGSVPFGTDTKEEEAEWGYSQMPDLLETIAEVGKKHIGRVYKVEMVNTKEDQAIFDSDIVVTTVGLQAQIKFRKQASKQVIDDIANSLKDKPYYGSHLNYEELRVRGSLPRFADLVVSPKPPYHFSHDFKYKFYAVNQHDSLDDGAQRIFTMMSGPDIKSEKYYNEEIHNIDIAPTIARLLGFEGPRDATSSSIDQALIEKYRGPKLEIKDSKDNIINTSEDYISIELETEAEAEIYLNKKILANSDENGKFTVKQELKEDINRLIIEAKKNGKTSRKVVFVIKR